MNLEVEEIKSRINLVDFIGEYIRLQKGGANWKAPCPFHREKSPSFMVSEEKQIWHCFGCGKGGDAFGFLMEMESLSFPEALKVLAEKAGVELKKYQPNISPEMATSKEKMMEILEVSTKFYEKQLWDGAGKTKIMEYLHKRGFNDESIKKFRLGYAPAGWRNLLDFLSKRGYLNTDIEKTGLLVKKENSSDMYDRFRDRIIFPIQDVLGKVIGYSARVAPGGDESQAKYVNTPETIVYHKSRALYGLDKAKKEIKNNNFTLVVEGNLDVVASHQAGVKNTVAVSGTALTVEQLDTLKRYSENIKLLFDMDSAGHQATRRSAELAFQKDFNVSIVILPEGKDAAELAEKDKDKFLQAVKNSIPAAEYFFQDILKKYDKTKAADKKSIAKEMIAIINNFKNDIEKSHWVKKISQEIGIDEKILADMVKKTAKNESVEQKEKENFFPDRQTIIKERIAGLILASSALWKKVAEDLSGNDLFQRDPMLRVILEKGPQSEFNFEKFLPIVEEQGLANNIFQKAYFEVKYNSGEKENVEEVESDNFFEMFDSCFGELKKEIKKEELETIRQDIEKAEKNNDKEGLKLLMSEFSRISKE
jgi:DNA primase